jgi:peptide/nickel transport system substrate-binding protein
MPGASLDTWEHITFNLVDPIVGELSVRQAIAYGTDRRALGEAWAPPYEPVVLNSFIRPDSSYYAGDANLAVYPFDPARARTILQQADWTDSDGDSIRDRNGVSLQLDYYTREDNPQRLRLAEAFRQQMRAIGVEIEVRTLSIEELVGSITNGTFQLAQFAWREDPLDFIPTEPFQHGCDWYQHSLCIPNAATGWEGNNVSRWENAQVDALLDQLVTAASLAEQEELLVELQQLFTAELPMLPLFYRPADS